MKLSNLLNQIESVEFSAYLGVASSFTVVLLGLDNSPTVKQLLTELQTSPERKHDVFQRLLGILPDNPQPEYAHPHDAAIAGYLYALSQVDPELTQQAVERILETPQLWWSRWLAKHIQESHPITPPTEEKPRS